MNQTEDTPGRRPVGHRFGRPFPEAREHDPHDPSAAGTTTDARFEGRRLHHPEEDVEDQGLAFDVATVVTRRGALGVLGAGSVVAVLAACSSTDASTTTGTSGGTSASDGGGSASSADSALTEMPGETAGPYPGDGSNGQDVLETSGVERSDIRTSIDSDTTADGVGLEITMTIIDMAAGDVPMEGAAVYLWQCDAEGRYSMYSSGVENETYLRGVQIADAQGKVTFTSIFPGCYSGRWPHLHFEVFPDAESIVDSTNAILTSQIALPQDAADGVYALDAYTGSAENLAQLTLETDGIFSDGYDQQLAQLSGSLESGYSFSIDVPIDTTTEPEAGGMGGGGAMGGGEPPSGGEGGPGGASDGGGMGGPGGEPPSGEAPSGEAPADGSGSTESDSTDTSGSDTSSSDTSS
ncbi:intradiol ring-cleavage dioxygenase [Brachybacterium aquaticum]|uniref:Protocatechuate 3,4-dioxygenase beta subunit n=1 Tax=Brachybacterium aquaticum TaxID=1432564 RepID=A0A841AG07_9MICO|nr:intradiol ring-cleavage dioxygenase [Brachybacterium aquaticum]MBB5832867.1 protocatechuate 3,4-dioxygenase beta subunit [Brachybacterium aquaticum]